MANLALKFVGLRDSSQCQPALFIRNFNSIASHFVFFALIGLIISPLAVGAHTSSSPTGSVHSYVPFDYEEWRREYPRPAGKRLAALNRGEPRTVRMIYFLPNDRPFRQEVVDSMKVMIRQVQTFYAEQMQAHGFGNRTFRFETDAQGDPLVHRVDGRHPDRHYLQYSTSHEVLDEIDPVFDIEANVYLIVIDNSKNAIWAFGDWVLGVGASSGKNGGYALVPQDGSFHTVAHELGHTFDLSHDFRDGTYIMSYGYGSSARWRLSACNAEFLAVDTYFNSSTPTVNSARPTSQLISPRLYSPGSVSVPIRLKVSGSKGLHQVILRGSNAYGPEVQACRGFAGQKEAVVQFEYDGTVYSRLSDFVSHPLSIIVVDTDGNVNYRDFALTEISPYLVATLTGESDWWVESVSFSPDGTTLAFKSSGSVELWDLVNRKKITTLDGDFGPVIFSPDGTMLADGWRVTLWDVASRRKITTLRESWYEAREAPTSVIFSPDGTMLAVGTKDGIELWDVTSRRKITTLTENLVLVLSVSFSPDGTMLAAGTEDGIELWDVASRRKITTLTGWTISVVFSPDGTMLAAKSEDRIELWDVVSREKVSTLMGAGSPMVFSPDGTMLASGDKSRIELWNAANGRKITTLGNSGWVESMSFSPNGTILAAGLEDGTVALWDVSEIERPHTLTKVSGDGQEGQAGEPLAKPFVVSVLDEDGVAMAGVAVSFSATAGGGTLSSTTVTTDANGRARSTLTLGSDEGTNTVSATVEGLDPVTFTATAITPHSLTKVSGDGQQGPVSTQLAKPFVVLVLDEEDAAMAGVVVTFTVTGGGGTMSSTTAITSPHGRAARTLTLGDEPGANTVEVSVAGLDPVAFTATAIGEELSLDLSDLFNQSGKLVALPDRTQLLQNAPNPFNSQTVVSYFLLEPGPVRLEVFSLSGQRVAVLQQGPQEAGYHRLHWDGRDAAGRSVASGTYLYRLVTDEVVLTRKLVLLR